MTKIKFKKKKIYPNLLLGVVWLIIGILDFVFSNELGVFSYFYLVIGILYLSFFLYDLKHQYLKIENHTIKKNILYGGWNRKLRLEDINAIEKTHLNYILKTKSYSLKINADLMKDESYKEFKSILKSLNLPEDKIPALL